jgi:hypothetical protein
MRTTSLSRLSGLGLVIVMSGVVGVVSLMLCCTLACSSRPPVAPAEASDVVGEVASLRFHSAFWINLHHTLYAEAWARRGVPPARSLAGAFPQPLAADLTADERAAWDRAVAYYDRALASRDLLDDDAMDQIRQSLLAPEHRGLAPEHAAALAAAAPVYRAHWWPTHDRSNREWIADAITRVRSLAPAVPERLSRLYRTPWFATPVRVDVVFVGQRQGAYTALAPAPAHITIASSRREDHGWVAAETVFHEASHALVAPIREVFGRDAATAGKSLPALWHVALFYLTGEVVRQALAARGIDYTPYLYATGLFDRAWPQLRSPIEVYWRPYVDGARDLERAVAEVVAAAP